MHEVMRVDAVGGEVGHRAARLPLPAARSLGVRVREARPEDLAFVDRLQKLHTRAVGWMPTGQLEGHIARGHVLIAVEADPSFDETPRCESGAVRAHPHPGPLPGGERERVGYCIAVDKYFKREDVGIIYQMNIEPGRQRGLIGATLLKAQFDRSPYGVKLYCCWCAQDLAANRFWEAMGFVPLAFRTGSQKRSRIHIFWQKRIREGDTQTQWWYPSQTGAGALKEDRLVLPIPPGTHWSDAKPMVLPGVPGEPGVEGEAGDEGASGGAVKALAGKAPRKRSRGKQGKAAKEAKEAEPAAVVRRNGLMFDIPRPGEPLPEEQAQQQRQAKAKAKAKSARVQRKNDPRYVAAARELRDRWLEQVAAQPGLIAPGPGAKYEVSRQLDAEDGAMMREALPGVPGGPGVPGEGAAAAVGEVVGAVVGEVIDAAARRSDAA